MLNKQIGIQRYYTSRQITWPFIEHEAILIQIFILKDEDHIIF